MPLALHLSGIHLSQPLVVTSATGCHQSHLLFVTDWTSGLRFLVDTGAEVSVLPVSELFRSSLPAGHPLQAANNLSRDLWYNILYPQPWNQSDVPLDFPHCVRQAPYPQR